jgi:hypothetical protein
MLVKREVSIFFLPRDPFEQSRTGSVSTASNEPGSNPDAKHCNGGGSRNSATRQIQPDCLKLDGKVVRHHKGGGAQLCSPPLLMTVSSYSAFLIGESVSFYHSWASASRPLPPASVFRHPLSQSGTVAFRYRTGVPLFRYRTFRRPAF